jgi:hypothetical protein
MTSTCNGCRQELNQYKWFKCKICLSLNICIECMAKSMDYEGHQAKHTYAVMDPQSSSNGTYSCCTSSSSSTSAPKKIDLYDLSIFSNESSLPPLVPTMVIPKPISFQPPQLQNYDRFAAPKKPVIYFYSNTDLKVTTQLELFNQSDKFSFLYPEPTSQTSGGNKIEWKVQVKANQSLFLEEKSNMMFSELFWEANLFKSNYLIDFQRRDYDVISKANLIPYFEKILPILGLNDHERCQFINYWAPQMQEFKYSFVIFSQDYINRFSKLNVMPKPDLLLRVFMIWYGSNQEITESHLLHNNNFDNNNQCARQIMNKSLESANTPAYIARQIMNKSLESTNTPTFVAIEWGGVQIHKY